MKLLIVSVGKDFRDWPPETWGTRDWREYREQEAVRATLPPLPQHSLQGFGGLHEATASRAERRARAVDELIETVRGRTVRASSSEVDEALGRLGVRPGQQARKRARLDPGVIRRDLGAVLRVK
jgi:hypothetical protein